MNRDVFVQISFLLSVFAVLLQAKLLETGAREPSALDGMYVPILLLLTTYVIIYMGKISHDRFVAYSVLFCVILSVLPAIKYQFLIAGDVNYFYRIVESTVDASTFNAVSELPSHLVGIYPSFPGFVILNAAFVKVTGLSVLTGYKFLFPVLYGTLYPLGFWFLSKLITNSFALRRAVVLVSVIPYAILPGAPWNRFMMPSYFDFLLYLLALYLILRPVYSSRTPYAVILIMLFAAMVITHPLPSLYLVIAFTGFLVVKAILLTFTDSRVDSALLSTSLAAFGWILVIAWSMYSRPTAPYFQAVLIVAVKAFIEGLGTPPVTQRLESAGAIIFLITHISKLAIGSFALIGIVSLAKRKIPELRIGHWIVSAAFFLFSMGIVFFVLGYGLFDIYVGYRSLFLSMVILTLASGLGVAVISRAMASQRSRRVSRIRGFLLGLLLILVLTGSLFELYPTEYVNPTLVNSVHTIYQKDAIAFLNAHWATSSRITMDHYAYQVLQSFGSLNVYENAIDPDLRQFFRLNNPLTTLIDTTQEPEYIAGGGVNLIYNSGFVMMNSTLT